MALPKHPFFYKLIAKAIDAFSENHNITGRSHFAYLLGFRGENAHVQLSSHLNYTSYVPSHPKPLTVDHLLVLLDELGEDRSIIIDGLLKQYDLIAVHKKQAQAKASDINLLVDVANMENSDVFRVVKESIADGIITQEEKEKILKEIEEAQKANAQLKDIVLHLVTNKE